MLTAKSVIRYLFSVVVVLTIYCGILVFFGYFNDGIGMSVAINLACGFYTALLISFVEYNSNLNNNIVHFLSVLFLYKKELDKISKIIDSSTSIDEKVARIDVEIKFINSNAQNQRQTINVDLLCNTKKNKIFTETITNTYELTFGIEFLMLSIDYMTNKRKTKKIKEKYIANIKELVDVELIQINENLSSLKKYNINKQWLQLQKSMKEKLLINQ